MILVPFFASSTEYGSTKNLLSLPFQAPVFFDLYYVDRQGYNFRAMNSWSKVVVKKTCY